MGDKTSTNKEPKWFIKIAEYFSKHKLFVFFRFCPKIIIYNLGMFVGEKAIGKSSKITIQKAFQKILNKKEGPIKNIIQIKNSARYLGLLLFDFLFVLPNLTDTYLRKTIRCKNLKYFEDAMKTRNGIIIPWIHLSQFMRGVLRISYLAPNREKCMIVNAQNAILFKDSLRKANITLISDHLPYQSIKKKIQTILHKNGIVFIAFDTGYNPNQLKTKFFNYLVPTPSSIVSLAKASGSIIIPIVLFPNIGFDEYYLEILKPFLVMEHNSDRETIGYYNTLLNNEFGFFIRKFPHLWEEIIGFEISKKTTSFFSFYKGMNKLSLLILASQYLKNIINNSWELNRDDTFFLGICRSIDEFVKKSQEKPIIEKDVSKIRYIIQLNNSSLMTIFQGTITLILRFPHIKCGIIGIPGKFSNPTFTKTENVDLIDNFLLDTFNKLTI